MDYHKIQLQLKKKLSEDTFIYKILYKVHRNAMHIFYGEYGVYRLKYLIGKSLRNRGFKDYRYINIQNFHNKYKGMRCFIVATGPSLQIKDIEKLENEITFGMNSLVSVFDKTEWRPTFYVVQDCMIWDRNKEAYFNENEINFWIGSNVARYDSSAINKENTQIYPLDLHNHDCVNNKDRKEPKNPNFSFDAYVGIEDGYTVTYSVIQLAVYMGFSEIYLLGVDCNYSGLYSHIGARKGDSSLLNDMKRIGPESQMLCSYKVARQKLDIIDVKIYNASRGGKMEVFTRIDIDNLLCSKEVFK